MSYQANIAFGIEVANKLRAMRSTPQEIRAVQAKRRMPSELKMAIDKFNIASASTEAKFGRGVASEHLAKLAQKIDMLKTQYNWKD